MSENIIVNGGIDQIYASLLNDLKSEIADKLTGISTKMSKQWGVDVTYRPARFLNCTLNKILFFKINKLCESCEDYYLCEYFKRIMRYFIKYNLLVFPYVPFIRRISSNMLLENMLFLGSIVKNVIFVNSSCFKKECEFHLIYSALNNTFHEFFNTIPDDYIENYIVPSIDRNSFLRFIATTDLHNKLLMIYGKKELIPKNEAVIRYICNNEDTNCLLEALFNGDSDFQPPEDLERVYIRLVKLLKELEVVRN